jgi:ketosteroid isomerase-like protein
MSDADVRDLAKRFFDAIEAGDFETVADCYAEDAVIWHNTDRMSSTKAENLKVLANFVKRAPVRRYDERKLTAWPGGFVHQHVLRSEKPDGTPVQLHAAIVCAVREGRITRLDEYFDSAELATWRP